MTDRGCFALPSTFSHTSKVCLACEARTACGEKVFVTLQRIRGVLPVNQLIAQFTVGPDPIRSLSLEQVQMIASMPARVGKRLESLFIQGFDVSARSQFANRINPFPHQGAKHLRLTGDLLLAGTVMKVALRDSFMQNFGWTKESAAVEVSLTAQLLRGLSLVNVTRHTIELANNND